MGALLRASRGQEFLGVQDDMAVESKHGAVQLDDLVDIFIFSCLIMVPTARQYLLAVFVFGLIFAIVGSVYLAKQTRARDFRLVDCSFVESKTVPARCPRTHYDGCGCLSFTNCRDVKPDSDVSYCCSGTCHHRYYSRGEWHTDYDDKAYRVTYVPCTRINAVFEIDGRNVSYSYVCDNGRQLKSRQQRECEERYEDRTSCYYDGENIRMANPYSKAVFIWSLCFVVIGCLLMLAVAIFLAAEHWLKTKRNHQANLQQNHTTVLAH